MAHLQYIDYEGYGERVRKDLHITQGVRIGDIIEIPGQGGWDRLKDPISIPISLALQTAQAFENVDYALRAAGADKGWGQVYKVNFYTLKLDDEMMGLLVENLRKWCPGHQPVVTGVVVSGLAFGMAVEVEVRAHVGG